MKAPKPQVKLKHSWRAINPLSVRVLNQNCCLFPPTSTYIRSSATSALEEKKRQGERRPQKSQVHTLLQGTDSKNIYGKAYLVPARHRYESLTHTALYPVLPGVSPAFSSLSAARC